jgi:hypothetical protein
MQALQLPCTCPIFGHQYSTGSRMQANCHPHSNCLRHSSMLPRLHVCTCTPADRARTTLLSGWTHSSSGAADNHALDTVSRVMCLYVHLRMYENSSQCSAAANNPAYVQTHRHTPCHRQAWQLQDHKVASIWQPHAGFDRRAKCNHTQCRCTTHRHPQTHTTGARSAITLTTRLVAGSLSSMWIPPWQV